RVCRCERRNAPRNNGYRLLALHAEQFDFEQKRRIGRNDTTGAARAIAEFGRDDECAFAADLHGGDTLVPAADDLPLTDAELKRLATIEGAVELLAFYRIFI